MLVQVWRDSSNLSVAGTSTGIELKTDVVKISTGFRCTPCVKWRRTKRTNE